MSLLDRLPKSYQECPHLICQLHSWLNFKKAVNNNMGVFDSFVSLFCYTKAKEKLAKQRSILEAASDLTVYFVLPSKMECHI